MEEVRKRINDVLLKEDYDRMRMVILIEIKNALMSSAEDKEDTVHFLRMTLKRMEKVGPTGPWIQLLKQVLKKEE